MPDHGRQPLILWRPFTWQEIAVVGVLGVLVALGLGAYFQQLTIGLGVTGLNSPAYWGAYIVNFVFFIGLSAGGIIVASLVHAFGIREFQSVARIAELMAIACLVLAMMFILLDLGRPDRMLFLFRHGRPQSPLIWDVTVVNSYLLIGLTYAYFGMRADLVRAASSTSRRRWLYRALTLGYTDLSPHALARDHRVLRVLAVVGLFAAVALHTVTAWILGLVKARPGWHGAIIAPLFIVSATVSGVALLIVSVVFSRRVLRLPLELRAVLGLGKLLAASIPILGYFLFAELLTVVYTGEPAALQVYQEMMFGRYAPVFWGNLILGLLVPLAVLAPTLFDVPQRVSVPVTVLGSAALAAGAVMIGLRVPGVEGALSYALLWAVLAVPVLLVLMVPIDAETRIGVAAALVVLGVVAERWNIVVPPLIGYSHLPYPHQSYAPSGTELLLVFGIYAIGALLFVFAARLLPLVEHE